MRHCVHNHPAFVLWDSTRWPDETSNSLGMYSYTICNLQKAEGDCQNQYRPAMCKVCRESEQKRDCTAPTGDSCQPGCSSRKPDVTQRCARVFICTSQKQTGRHRFCLSPMVLDMQQEYLHLWMSPSCSNPPGDSYKTDREYGARAIAGELREGNASRGGAVRPGVTSSAQNMGSGTPSPQRLAGLGTSPREHPQGGASSPASPAGNRGVAAGLMAAA